MESIWKAMGENKESRKGKNKFWTQSGASLREVRESKGSEAEAGRTKEEAKFRLRSLENAYGSISFDVNEERQVEITVARRTAFEEAGLREDQKRLEEEHQAPVRVGAGKGCTDSHYKEDSAIVWKADAEVTPERVMEELKRLSRMSRQKTLSDMIPSLEPEQLQSDRDFHYNLLKKIKTNLTETLREARRTEDGQGAVSFLQFGQPLQEAEQTDAGDEEDEIYPNQD